MFETLAALVFAHVLADFVFQTNGMAAGKRKAGVMALHGGIVLATAVVAVGGFSPWLLVLAVAHIAIDTAKTFSGRRGIWPFLLDQAAHGATLVALACWQPGLWAQGIWAPWPVVPAVMVLATGLVVTTRAGGFAVGLLMEPWNAERPEGLPGGGRLIGLLERGLIFVLILVGQAQGIGFLIAAKSVLRFSDTKDDRRISEYVIIGTLASVTWAIAATFVTVELLERLAPLGIPGVTP